MGKWVSSLGNRTADQDGSSAAKSKEVKKAFKATIYPASRHEESRRVWVWPILADGMSSSDLGHDVSIRVGPRDGMAWTSLIRFHFSLFVADLKEEAAPGCTHQMLRTVSWKISWMCRQARLESARECLSEWPATHFKTLQAMLLVRADQWFTPCITRSTKMMMIPDFCWDWWIYHQSDWIRFDTDVQQILAGRDFLS